MLIRQIVGALALIVFIVMSILVPSEPAVRGTNLSADFIDVFSLVVMTIWLVASGVLKLAMIFNKKWLKLHAFSSISWMILMLLIILPVHSHSGTSNQYSAIQNFAGFFIFFGWFLIDLADKFYILRDAE